jgi:anti-sigma regulatory factor (Ser/Thr protein kinase)
MSTQVKSTQVEPGVVGELRLDARASELASARRYAEAAAAAYGLDPDDGYDFAYAVNEAVTNAIRHGLPDGDGKIELNIRATPRRLVFCVRDFGTFTALAWPLRAGIEGGRGFTLMARLVDDVQLRIAPHGTTVILSKARM